MKIIESSSQYKNRIEKENRPCCPECGNSKLLFGTVRTEQKGILNIKFKDIHTSRCPNCNCQFEYEDEWR